MTVSNRGADFFRLVGVRPYYLLTSPLKIYNVVSLTTCFYANPSCVFGGEGRGTDDDQLIFREKLVATSSCRKIVEDCRKIVHLSVWSPTIDTRKEGQENGSKGWERGSGSNPQCFG